MSLTFEIVNEYLKDHGRHEYASKNACNKSVKTMKYEPTTITMHAIGSVSTHCTICS